ncbi:MAG: dihydroorotate dehydrogenase-like protein [Spirochaetales bacterium]|nr:dihydroorotate dehydrogenase-like protein [Spirochaetales bacterium]MCF7939180.1 dihydroorotate dehydrogenase-like protein [Spirochaetales bacterium]
MADLKTRYMGLELKNPVVAGASSLTSQMGSIKKLEDSGVGALVISSLFEEQIRLESMKLDDELNKYNDWNAEMQTVFPEIEHGGPDEHLMWLDRAKEALDIPVVASLNAVSRETWVEWASKIEQTGVDALELNFYSLPMDYQTSSDQMEDQQIETLKEVLSKVKIPVSVKLSPYYTSPLRLIKRMDEAGVKGFVLFNRLFQPSIDIHKERNQYPFNLSSENDYRLTLRFAGILGGQTKGSICASHGIHEPDTMIQMLLAGADCVQVVSAIFKHKFAVVKSFLNYLEEWMENKGYKSLDDFRGKLNKENTPDTFAYSRFQYVRLLLKSDELLAKPPII